MTQLPITPRENWLRMLRHEKPLWMPLFSDQQLIMPAIMPDNVARAELHEAKEVPQSEWGGKDMYGIEWVYVPSVMGSMERPDVPHLLDDICEWSDKVPFPDMDTWDWEGAAQRNKDYLDPDKLRVTWFFTGMFERLISFMGFENAAMTLIDDECEDDLHALFDALADNAMDYIGRMKKYFDIDLVYFHDDWGSQRSPFFSERVAREIVGPHIKRIIDFCHSIGVYFELHSCGMIENLAPVMIEIGVDCWCGQNLNDKFKLYDTYGDEMPIGFQVFAGPDDDLRSLTDDIIARIEPKCSTHFMYMQDIVAVEVATDEGFQDYVREKTMEMYARAK